MATLFGILVFVTLLWCLWKATIPTLIFIIMAFGFEDRLDKLMIPLFLTAVVIVFTAPVPGLSFLACGVLYNYFTKLKKEEEKSESSDTEHDPDSGVSEGSEQSRG